MTNRVEFVNQALTLLRANPIGSFLDDTNEANIVNIFYNDFVQDLFSRHPWSFSLEKRSLSKDVATPLNEYQNQFHIPTDVIKIFSYFNSDATGAKPISSGWTIQGALLMTDFDKAVIEGTFFVDERLWPGYFIEYARYALAALLAIPITQDEGLEQLMWARAYGSSNSGTVTERGGKFQIAAGIDSKQQPPHEIVSFDLISARFGSGRFGR